jgi:pyridoxamine 5'-phosphate oxidase
MPLPLLEDLAHIRAALWAELTRATNDKHHEWRTGALATVNGEVADARTVVLREVDAPAQTLRFFSDARAGKVAQIQAHPHGTLLMWSRRLSWQLRLRVTLSTQTEGLAVSSRWARLKLSPAAQDYLAPLAPGVALQTPTAVGNRTSDTNSNRTAGATTTVTEQRAYFALLTANVVSMDWLELRATGHRRAVFDAANARWVTP